MDGATQRSSPELLVVAFFHQEVRGGLGERQGEILLSQAFVDLFHEDVNDLSDLFAVEGMEDDGLVHPIEKLRIESPLDLVADLGLHHVV